MARDLTADVDLSPLLRQSERYAAQMGRGITFAFRRMITGMVRRAAAITPPASRASATGNSASATARPTLTKQDQTRGQTALARDLFAVFSGLGTSGGRRQRASSLVQALAIHDRLFAQKTPGRPLRSDRPNGDRYVLDSDVLAALQKLLEKRVGWSASGWRAGADATAVRLPAWVANKPGPGSASIQASGLRLSAFVANSAIPAKLERETTRRVRTAMGYQIAAAEREIAAVAKKAGRSSGLSTT